MPFTQSTTDTHAHTHTYQHPAVITQCTVSQEKRCLEINSICTIACCNELTS